MPDTIETLIHIIEQIAQGEYSDDIMAFTTQEHPEEIQRIAEAVGMMMVKVEAREYNLESLIDQLREANRTIKRNTLQTVSTIAKTLGARDEYTEGHAERVAAYSRRLALRLGLSEEEVESITVAGMLHDIGKISFSDKVFQNTSHATDDIFAEIRLHPVRTREILQELDFLGPAVNYAAAHHEKLDGSGYPDGLSADEIPYGAKILAVADCFDAITTTRSYQESRPVEEAFAILDKISGNHLDPDLVRVFIEEIRENGMEGLEETSD